MIIALTYGQEVNSKIYRFWPLIQKDLEGKTPDQIVRIRRKLNQLESNLPNNKRPYVQAVICLIKKYAKERLSMDMSGPYNHKLSDHAFIRALERMYGIDVSDMKDRVLYDLDHNKKTIKVMADTDKVITVLKKTLRRRNTMTEWKPISEAPRDGTEFQAWVTWDNGNRGAWEPRCCFDENGRFLMWGRIDYDEDGWDVYGSVPTHYMPQPQPPEGEKNDN